MSKIILHLQVIDITVRLYLLNLVEKLDSWIKAERQKQEKRNKK